MWGTRSDARSALFGVRIDVPVLIRRPSKGGRLHAGSYRELVDWLIPFCRGSPAFFVLGFAALSPTYKCCMARKQVRPRSRLHRAPGPAGDHRVQGVESVGERGGAGLQDDRRLDLV